MSENIKDMGLDEETKDFCIEKLKDVEKVAKIVGYETQFTNFLDGLPSLIIGVEKNYKNEDTIATCTALPLQIRGNGYLILQFNVIINTVIPEDKKDLIDELKNIINNKFMVGTLLNYDGNLSVKYCLYLSSEKEMDQLAIAKTIEILTIEADEVLKKVDKLISGEILLSDIIYEEKYSD